MLSKLDLALKGLSDTGEPVESFASTSHTAEAASLADMLRRPNRDVVLLARKSDETQNGSRFERGPLQKIGGPSQDFLLGITAGKLNLLADARALYDDLAAFKAAIAVKTHSSRCLGVEQC